MTGETARCEESFRVLLCTRRQSWARKSNSNKNSKQTAVAVTDGEELVSEVETGKVKLGGIF